MIHLRRPPTTPGSVATVCRKPELAPPGIDLTPDVVDRLWQRHRSCPPVCSTRLLTLHVLVATGRTQAHRHEPECEV